MQSSLRDLATEEAKRRLAQYGSNIITQERGVPLWRKFIANLTNFFAVLLWSAAALSFPTRGNESGVAIIEVILINAFFSFYQEYRAEQAVAALQKLLPAIAKVRRNGEVTQVQAAELVPGDILVLEEGDNTSADVVAAVTGGDKDNLVIALQARNEFHVPRIIARVNNPKNAWLFKKEMGVDIAVNPSGLIARLIQEETSLGEMVALLKLRRGELTLVEEQLAQNSGVVGKTIGDLNLPPETRLIAIFRQGEVLLSRGDTRLQADDGLLALAKTGSETRLAELLK